MGSLSPYTNTIILFVLLVLQCGYGSKAREINTKGQFVDGYRHHPSTYGMDRNDPALNVFFTVEDLFIGKKMPIYFSLKNPSTTPHILPRDKADSIPFASSQLPNILKFFSFSKHAQQAKSIAETLRQCELESPKGELKFCATSLESMIDTTRGVLGLDKKIEVLTTITPFLKPTTLLQNYTFVEDPKEVLADKMVACHTMPYPYAVFYCHSQEKKNKNRVFKISLVGENGDRIEAISVCHMDTSGWEPKHVVFQMLKIEPGSPVCHFMPTDNLVWVSAPSVI